MRYLNYCNPHDVAIRLYFRKRYWYHGNPKITLSGNEGSFGKLNFDFGDEIISMTIYIKERNPILDAATFAIMDFQNITDRMFEDTFACLPPKPNTSMGSQAWL